MRINETKAKAKVLTISISFLQLVLSAFVACASAIVAAPVYGAYGAGYPAYGAGVYGAAYHAPIAGN